MHRVVLEHVGHVCGVEEGVVDGDHLDVVAHERHARHEAADAAETCRRGWVWAVVGAGACGLRGASRRGVPLRMSAWGGGLTEWSASEVCAKGLAQGKKHDGVTTQQGVEEQQQTSSVPLVCALERVPAPVLASSGVCVGSCGS